MRLGRLGISFGKRPKSPPTTYRRTGARGASTARGLLHLRAVQLLLQHHLSPPQDMNNEHQQVKVQKEDGDVASSTRNIRPSGMEIKTEEAILPANTKQKSIS
jgi:hypothetical protein